MKRFWLLTVALLTALLARADVFMPAQDTTQFATEAAAKRTAAAGKATTLAISMKQSGAKYKVSRALVRFDLSNLPVDVQPTDIAGARLRVYFAKVTKAGFITAVPVASPWDESSADEGIYEVGVPGVVVLPEQVVAKNFVEIDVTAFVRAWRAGTLPNYGFVLGPAEVGTSVLIGAKEGPGSGYPCQLDVQIDRAGGTVGPGSIGATELADFSITNAKLAGTFTFPATTIADGSVTSAKLASGLTLGGTTNGTFSGPLAGNATSATTATTATTAGSAASFTGSLAGNVTGPQGATVVATVGGVTAANVAAGANLANAATNVNTASTIVKRDASGNFAAGTITGTFSGNGAGLTGVPATIADGSITAQKIADGAVTTAKIASGSITNDKIGNGSITADKLAPGVGGSGGGSGTLTLGLAASLSPSDPQYLSQGFSNIHTLPGGNWVASAAASAPRARSGHTAIWTGLSMIVWGGVVAGAPSNQGGEYNAASATWSTLSTNNAPAGRSGHTAVWTGSQMLVWGGGTSANPGGDASGGVFDEASQAWLTMSTTSAPSDRTQHSAVWAGDRMIVWGGNSPFGVRTDGGSFVPPPTSATTGTWAPLPASATAGVRRGHSAIWTGSAMIIWGGLDANGNPLNTGAALNPSTSAWTALPTLNAPSARYGHTAIWTGSKMIVFGGSNSQFSNGQIYDDGAIYDPAANTWTALPVLGSPNSRTNHAAVWTGSEMLVFGGQNAGGSLVTAGAFTVTKNAWRVLPAAPSGATLPAGVWSGTALLSFGLAGLQILDVSPTLYLYGHY